MKCTVCNKKLTGKQTKFCSRKCKNSKHQCYDKQQERGHRRKKELIKKLGGRCMFCGYHKNYAALCFHHREPELKKIKLDIRSLSNHSMKAIMLELEKCDLLCANCHSEIHNLHYKL